ncbi:MAG TPA: hypothetical protein VNT57_02460 [Desulfobacteria bacterium]|nr:hypothetical protein [Desulfobacteria bacterium]
MLSNYWLTKDFAETIVKRAGRNSWVENFNEKLLQSRKMKIMPEYDEI